MQNEVEFLKKNIFYNKSNSTPPFLKDTAVSPRSKDETLPNVKNTILHTFKTFSKRELFKDDFGALTGEKALQTIEPLQYFLHKYTLPHTRIVVCFPNSSMGALCILGVMAANRIPVIINASDASQKSQLWRELVKTEWIITIPELAPKFKDSFSQIISLNEYGIPKYSELKNQFAFTPNPEEQILFFPTDNPVAFVLYTSGSTGKPKEVWIPERGLAKTLEFLIKLFELSEASISQIVLPLSHTMALNTQFLPTFFVGGLSRFYNSSENLNKLFRSSLAEKVTFVSLIGELVRTCWQEKRSKNLEPCYSTMQMQMGGGLLTAQHLNMARELFPNATIHKSYGMTEAIRTTMINSSDPHFHSGAVGKPLPFVELQIRDENNRIVPIGCMGQIYIKSDSVMVNWWDEYLPSGDIGSFDEEGYLTVYGRMDSIFKVNGKRISGFEIEKTVYNSNDVIRFAKCLSIYDENAAGTKIILFLEIEKSSYKDLVILEKWQTALWEHLRRLDYYPRDIVLLEKFPRTSNGKLDLNTLKKIGERKNKTLLKQSLPFNLKFYIEEE